LAEGTTGTADEAGRKKIWEAHKQYTLEFIHFLTTDPAVPSGIRDRYQVSACAVDEFASYDHFSPALYVRESRRMKGLYVISQKDILDSPKRTTRLRSRRSRSTRTTASGLRFKAGV
jgi:hypothetical protein